ncbi:uncharacterized protein LOC100191281 [Zea mays]|uniref:DUF8204 domain-containing protein n=1 Tax=Zea mays TaxID=4577 RepID=B4F889_MAIZE|nr:uncharacterized protein LOC100191281 [Zea mays]ACF78332.1 unknown [Zea mays]ACG38060.1 hypothetical protein [Zea mays]AQK67153.1 hypothetical protein ZEAMMB73_Zm00001d014770 [Zea mays]|eukprot:NP_001130187.1 uncharacterized protein LOC100191281 [Zea mays]
MEGAAGEEGASTPAARGGAEAGAGAGAGGGMLKGRSCKGCLYYSSKLRSRARGPVCVGVTRALPQVSERKVGKLELEAIQEGRYLADFRYACIGYSMYLNGKETPTGVRDKPRAHLPVCAGVELLIDRKVPTNVKKEAPKPRQYKPGHAGDDFLTKFQRNAGLVASGVAKNLNRVGTYIKDTVSDMMQPHRKRPK